MIDENSPFSLYFQLKNIFIKNIKNDIWKVHTKIPSERELCESYGVSRITVRQALKELEDEGLLYRKQGKGTFVTIPKFNQRLSKLYSFSEEITKMGSVPAMKILSFNLIKADSVLADRLNIEPGDKAFEIRRLRMADGEPFAVEISYIVQKYARALTEEAVRQSGLYNALYATCGITPDWATETFEAVIITNQEAELLKVHRKSAGLHLERTAWANEKTLEYCISTIRGDKYKYTVKLEK